MNKQIKKISVGFAIIVMISLLVGVLAVGCEYSLHKDISVERQFSVWIGSAAMVFAGLFSAILFVTLLQVFEEININE